MREIDGLVRRRYDGSHFRYHDRRNQSFQVVGRSVGRHRKSIILTVRRRRLYGNFRIVGEFDRQQFGQVARNVFDRAGKFGFDIAYARDVNRHHQLGRLIFHRTFQRHFDGQRVSAERHFYVAFAGNGISGILLGNVHVTQNDLTEGGAAEREILHRHLYYILVLTRENDLLLGRADGSVAYGNDHFPGIGPGDIQRIVRSIRADLIAGKTNVDFQTRSVHDDLDIGLIVGNRPGNLHIGRQRHPVQVDRNGAFSGYRAFISSGSVRRLGRSHGNVLDLDISQAHAFVREILDLHGHFVLPGPGNVNLFRSRCAGLRLSERYGHIAFENTGDLGCIIGQIRSRTVIVLGTGTHQPQRENGRERR